ncbi:MAG: GNAT family N-acetyltransferase [Thermomicrobiales bacterium]
MRSVDEPAIRAMEQSDIPRIAEWMAADDLWQRYRLSPATIAADFERGLERADLMLVADGEVPACGFAWCLPTGMFGAFPYLKRFAVDPACAGQGVGSRLLDRLESALLARQQRELFLLVSDFNLDAQRFYQRHGYAEIGRVSELVLPGVAELLLRKQLQGLS